MYFYYLSRLFFTTYANRSRTCVHAGLRIKENKEVYEGEVTELTPEETQTGVG